MMDQFRVVRNQYGNLYIYLYIPCRGETCVALKQFNQRTGLWE